MMRHQGNVNKSETTRLTSRNSPVGGPSPVEPMYDMATKAKYVSGTQMRNRNGVEVTGIVSCVEPKSSSFQSHGSVFTIDELSFEKDRLSHRTEISLNPVQVHARICCK